MTSATHLTPPTGAPAPDPRRWAAFLIMTVAVFMDLLDSTIVTVALPSIQQDLGSTPAELQWTAAGYILAFALMLVTGGRLGDIHGRKRMFQLGVAGFALTSLACGLAVDPVTLIGARILQGAAAGLMVPQVLAIVHVTFPDEEKGTVYAVQGMISGIAATVGPVIGGALLAADLFGSGWRLVFLINVPIGVAGFLLGTRWIPESRSTLAPRLDLVGVALSATALLLLLVPLTLGPEQGWSVWSAIAAAASVPVFGLFLRHQARTRDPLVPLALFRARSFSAGLAVLLVVYAFIGTFMIAIYLYAQIGLGWTPLRTGSTLLAFAGGAFMSSALSTVVLVQRFGRLVLQAGALAIAAGLVLLAITVGADTTSWALVPGLVVIGLGFGACAAPIALFGLQDVPAASSGAASGMINTMVQIGVATGIALASVTFFAPLGDRLDGQAYSDALEITLWTCSGLAVLAFLAASALPARLREPASP